MASERRRQRIERLLNEAEKAVSQFDWFAVRNCRQAVLAFDTENADAMDLLTAAEGTLRGSEAHCAGLTRTGELTLFTLAWITASYSL